MNFKKNKSKIEDKNNESVMEPLIEAIDENKIYRKDDGVLYNIYKCAKLNWLYYLILYVSTLIIDYYTDKNWQLSLWTILYIQVWSYFLHYISHKRYIYNSLGFDLHDSHHSDKSRETLNILKECYANFAVAGGFIIIFINIIFVKYYGKWMKYMNYYVILFWAYIYVSYHMINYHYLKFKTHDNHHKLNGNTNFGPDWVDIIFKTKPDNDEIENSNSSILNAIIALVIILLTLNTYLDPIKFLMDYFVPKDIIDSPDTNLWKCLYNKFFKSSVKIVVDSDINDKSNLL